MLLILDSGHCENVKVLEELKLILRLMLVVILKRLQGLFKMR